MYWKYPTLHDRSKIRHISAELSISESLGEVLVRRGVDTFELARQYFRPTLEMLHDPFSMAGMQAAVDRLVSAIEREEKVLIYGDYDVDGTTSVAMFFHFLSSIYPNCDFYIPDRYKEGYGISGRSVEWASAEGFTLVITLDCGIKSVEHIAHAKALGIDYIVCDHHTPGEQLPDAVAILDPKRADCDYPYKELSGCGVGFKFIQAFCQLHNGIDYPVMDLLDLVAVSIASDIVRITGENRVLAFYGLKQLRESPRPGLRALMDIAGVTSENMSIMRIVFGLAPRINAAGRLKDARAAVELMLSDNDILAKEFAVQLDHHNSDRKALDQATAEEAIAMIEQGSPESNTTVLYKSDWHKGIIGIVASRCIESYYRPTIIFTRTAEGILSGSARSVDGFNVYEALEKCSDCLEQFGGHKYAAGMTIREDLFDKFKTRFESVVHQSILPEQRVPSLLIDASIRLEEITDKFFRILRQMAPFGPGNEEVVFIASGLSAINIRVFSSRNNPASRHLKFQCVQGRKKMEAIGFNLGHLESELSGNNFSMAFAVSENNYRGQHSLQLHIKDIKKVYLDNEAPRA